MCLAAFAAMVSVGMQTPAAPPDRTGEPELRKIMEWAKGLDDVHLVINTEARDTGNDPMYPGDRIDVWISGARFRIERSGYWGYGSYVVSDGKTVLSDSQSEGDPAIVANAKDGLLATCADLKVSTGDMSPFFALMNGPAKLDTLVDKTAAIKLEPDRGDEKVISFQHKKLGTERLFYHLVKATVQLDRIEYDNLPETQEEYKNNAEWMDPPDPGMLTRHSINVEVEGPDGRLFDPKPPKGREVEDRRIRKKSGGQGRPI